MWYALTTFMSAQAHYGGDIMGESPTARHYTRGGPAGLDGSLYSHIPACILYCSARYYQERYTGPIRRQSLFRYNSRLCWAGWQGPSE